MEFSPATRKQNIDHMQSGQFDVIVIGGGITGAGIARVAALRGLSVALLEKGDFACGTSSKSARMVHGGLRYLEQLHIGLVRSACAERHLLLNIAPQLVHPATFIFPIYLHAKNSLRKVGMGMWLYEFLALFRNIKRHKKISPQVVNETEPAVRQENLSGAIYYYDCLTNDARLTLANVKSAHTLGALVANYTQVTQIGKEDGKVIGVEAEDLLSGQEFFVKGKVVANAAGVWVDKVRFLDDPDAVPDMRANRGSHVVLPREKVPINNVIIFTSPDGERGMYAVPWKNTVIVGTTDLDHHGDLDDVHATSEEVQVILESVNDIFSDAHVGVSDVIATYAGLRPLIGSGEEDAYQTSRDHKIYESPSGMLSIAGGKLTTHRKMAEDMVDHIVRKLAKEDPARKFRSSDSQKVPVAAQPMDVSNPYSKLTVNEQKFSYDVVMHLMDTYGPDAKAILTIAETNPSMHHRIDPSLPYIFAEIPYSIQNEMTMTLSDFLIRRIQIIYESGDQGQVIARAVAKVMTQYLGWNKAETERNIDCYLQQVQSTNHFRTSENVSL